MSDDEEIQRAGLNQRADLIRTLLLFIDEGYLDIMNMDIYNQSIEELEQTVAIVKIVKENKEHEQFVQLQEELKTTIIQLLTNGELIHYIDIILAEIKPEHDSDKA